LEKYLTKKGVQVHKKAEVKDFLTEGNKVLGVILKDGQEIMGDAFVIAAGYESANLMRKMGMTLPLLPVKGHSIDVKKTVEMGDKVIILGDQRVYFIPIGNNQIRMPCFADLVGEDYSVDMRRVKQIEDAFQKALGVTLENAEVNVFAGLRPMSPDDVPIIGPTKKYRNLFLNVGHGAKGLSFSAGSAFLLNNIMTGVRGFEMLEQGYTPERFNL